MRGTTPRRIAWLTAAALPVLVAWSAVDSPLRLQPASRLWVSGTSTVRSFECAAKTFDLNVDANAGSPVAAVLSGEKAVTTVTLRVNSDQLDCNNDKMNEHMLKALKAKEFADITFTIASYDLTKASEGATVALKGNLSLGGITKPITIEALVLPSPGGALKVSGLYPLHMTEFGLQPPKLMLGALKVNELVNVNFELLLKS